MRFTFIITLLVSSLLYAQKTASPIGFIENKGQIIDQKGKQNKNVLYLLNTPGLNIQLKKNGFSYDVYEAKKVPLTQKEKDIRGLTASLNKENTAPDYSLEYDYHRIDIDFVNANPDTKLIHSGKSKDYDNYYNVVHAPEGITGVHKYQKVTYQNIYSNIDVVFFIPDDKTKAVEYNFIIKPGGKVSDIKMQFNGVKTELADNKIKMNVGFGQMEETLPLSWIEQGNVKKEIAVNYVNIKKNVYGFEGAVNTSDKTIVIDPVPVRLWGTYYGGNSLNLEVTTLDTDLNQNVYMSGFTYSNNNIATAGAFVTTNINYDKTSYLVKFNDLGQRIWGTYIKNGDLAAYVYDGKTNSSNEIYVAGFSWSSPSGVNTLTTPGSHKQNSSNPFSDGFILKFNENGVRIWGTFFGGDDREMILSLCLDQQENIIITGMTHSLNGISTGNAYLTNFPSSSTFYSAGFFSKFSPGGVQLYGSYYPITIDKSSCDLSGNIYFSGVYTNSTDYPNIATPGSHQSSYTFADAYLTKFNSSFNLQWCTYYGGFDFETVAGIGTDQNSNVYMIGATRSQQNITTPGSFKDTLFPGATNSYIVKFNTNGQRQWGTYFGHNSDLSCYDGFVTPDGDIYITGTIRIYMADYDISTPDAFQPQSRGSDEGYFSKFNTNGGLVWSSYYGTISQDYCNRVLCKDGFVYLAGYSTGVATNGNDLGTPGTHMPNGGGYLSFLAKFQNCLSSPLATSNSPICVGQNLQLNASGGATYSWTGPNGFASTDQNPVITNANAIHSGQYSCTITGTGGCDGTIMVNVAVGDTIAPVADNTNLPTITGDCNTVVTTIPTSTDNCSGTINGTTSNPLSYTIPGNYTITWTYNDGNGNTSTQNQSVVITATALPTAVSSQQFCIQQNATLNAIAITGQNIKWYDAQSGGNLLAANTLLQNGVSYYASQTINSCESTRIQVTVTIQNTPAPTGNANQTFCTSENATLNNISIAGTDVKWYADAVSTQPLVITTLLTNNTTYYATQTINGCASPIRLAVTITLINTLNAQNHQVEFCDDLDNGIESVDLSSYNTNLITNANGNTFTYYKSLSGAENQTASERITNSSNYQLQTGTATIYVRIENVNTCHQIVALQLSLFSKPAIQGID